MRHGVVLLDEREIVFRIYETTEHDWQLSHYHSALLPIAGQSIEITAVLEIIGAFFATESAQHIADWKICSRQFPKNLVNDLQKALAITVENLSLHREQELLCKGMFTELW